MHRAIQHSLIFATIFILASAVMGDAFDQTVDQIKILETELEQNQIDIDEKQGLIEEALRNFRANHPLDAPQGEFESDADYAARLRRLAEAVAQRRAELEEEHLSSLRADRLEAQTEISRLHRRTFFTNDITATLGPYNANEEYFPITFVANNESVDVRLNISRQNDAPTLKSNWDKVVKTAYISIDPGYRRALTQVRLEYPPLWENGITWRFNLVYDLGNNNSIAFSPDGKYIATASHDEYGIANIWTMEDGKKFRKMDHGTPVDAVEFSLDGKYFATAGGRGRRFLGQTIVWEMNKGTKVHTLEHSSAVRAATFSPDGKYLATSFLSQYIGGPRGPYLYIGFAYLWSAKSGDWVRSIKYNAYNSTIPALTFSPNGEFLATGNASRNPHGAQSATLWKASNGNPVRHFAHRNVVGAIAFSPNSKYLATGSYESITFWEIGNGRSVRQIELPDTGIYAVTFSPDGEFLAVGKNNGYIDLFRVGTEDITLETGIPRVRSIWTGEEVRDLAWHPSGNFISDGRKVYRPVLPSEVVNLIPTILFFSEIDPVKTGTQFTLDFTIKDVTDLAGWQTEVAFNPEVLSVVEAKEGNFIKTGGKASFFQEGNVDNATGKVTGLSGAILGGSVSGEGTLFSITFEAKIAGDGQLQLLNTQLSTLSTESIPHELIIHPVVIEDRPLFEDVNKDKVVNIQDLVLVASNFGQTGPNDADVNEDGVVNIQDLVMVAAALGTTAAAPSTHAQILTMLTTTDVQQWLSQAQHLDLTDPTSQRGIRFLEQLLAALTPKETALLPNYPNPFNPETWIPYQLAKPADVTVSIYSSDGKLVRALNLGHQPVGVYYHRSRAAYWDGKNELAEPVASGVYFYTLTAGEFTATRKMLISKVSFCQGTLIEDIGKRCL